MTWNSSRECMDRETMRTIQEERLKKQVVRMYQRVPSFRQKMQEKNLMPSDIESLEDLQKLPFITKDDMRENYPDGLFGASMDEVIRIHASSGTTGKPTMVGYTEKDLRVWEECMMRVLTMAGISHKDIVQVAYGYGLFTGGLGLHYGVESLGATVIPVGTSGTKKQLKMMKDLKVTAIACTPSYLQYLAEEILKSGEKEEYSLRVGILGGEPWTDSMRLQLEEDLNIKLYDIYGLSEIMGPGVAAECECHAGLHIYEDYFYPEIIDPETLEVLDEGELGELVITTLSKEASPMIRYRTKDLTRLTREKCSCGRTLARISKLMGRSDDMIIVKGVNIFPSQIEEVLLSVDGISSHYLIKITREGAKDELEVLVEVDEENFSGEIRVLEKLRRQIVERLKEVIGIQAKVRLVEPRSIERTSGKSTRVLDERSL